MKENGKDFAVVFGKTDNVLAYCSDCRTLVFHGNDQNNLRKMVLKRQVMDHTQNRIAKHTVDVIYPRNTDGKRIIPANIYLGPQGKSVEVPTRGLRDN